MEAEGMLSLELARKLKEAGLEWEPKFGDHYIIPAVFEEGLHEVMDTKQIMSYHKNPKEWEESIRGFVFTPRLDQLLAEIERQGWKYTLTSRDMNGANEDYLCWIVKWAIPTEKRGLYGATPEEAAAAALIWICLKGS